MVGFQLFVDEHADIGGVSPKVRPRQKLDFRFRDVCPVPVHIRAENDHGPYAPGRIAPPPVGWRGLFGDVGGDDSLDVDDVAFHDPGRGGDFNLPPGFGIFRFLSSGVLRCLFVLFPGGGPGFFSGFLRGVGFVFFLVFGRPLRLRDLDGARLCGSGVFAVGGDDLVPDGLSRKAPHGGGHLRPRGNGVGAPETPPPLVPLVGDIAVGGGHFKPEIFGIGHPVRPGGQTYRYGRFRHEGNLPGDLSLVEDAVFLDLLDIEAESDLFPLVGRRIEDDPVVVAQDIPVQAPLIPVILAGGPAEDDGPECRRFRCIEFRSLGIDQNTKVVSCEVVGDGDGHRRPRHVPCGGSSLDGDLDGPAFVSPGVKFEGVFGRGAGPDPVHLPEVALEAFAVESEGRGDGRYGKDFPGRDLAHRRTKLQDRSGTLFGCDDGHLFLVPDPVALWFLKLCEKNERIGPGLCGHPLHTGAFAVFEGFRRGLGFEAPVVFHPSCLAVQLCREGVLFPLADPVWSENAHVHGDHVGSEGVQVVLVGLHVPFPFFASRRRPDGPDAGLHGGLLLCMGCAGFSEDFLDGGAGILHGLADVFEVFSCFPEGLFDRDRMTGRPVRPQRDHVPFFADPCDPGIDLFQLFVVGNDILDDVAVRRRIARQFHQGAGA